MKNEIVMIIAHVRRVIETDGAIMAGANPAICMALSFRVLEGTPFKCFPVMDCPSMMVFYNPSFEGLLKPGIMQGLYEAGDKVMKKGGT